MTLQNGESLPEIPAMTTESMVTTIGAHTVGGWSVVLLYRGHW